MEKEKSLMKINCLNKILFANTVYNSLLVQAYLRKSSHAKAWRDGFSIRFVFAKLVAETRNDIIHNHVTCKAEKETEF